MNELKKRLSQKVGKNINIFKSGENFKKCP